MNKQLEKHKIIIKKGTIIDASIIDTPLRPKGKPTYEVLDEREATEETESRVVIEKKVSSRTDMEARWIKKGGIKRYGYKKHVVTDEEGLV